VADHRKALNLTKLAKVMALLDSDNDGEAVAAFMAVRKMLRDSGRTWSDFQFAPSADDAGAR
jgi:hypothetical protein